MAGGAALRGSGLKNMGKKCLRDGIFGEVC